MINKTLNIEDIEDNVVLINYIITEYTVNAKSIEQIAKQYDLTIYIVRRILIDNNIVLRVKNNKIV